jgi:S-methylmethionine-dependent homocysteine/selenocysteine methylase
LIAAGIRTLVFETIPSLKEVECLGKVLDQFGPEIRAWVVNSCEDGKRTRCGDLFADVVKLANSMQKASEFTKHSSIGKNRRLKLKWYKAALNVVKQAKRIIWGNCKTGGIIWGNCKTGGIIWGNCKTGGLIW